MLLTYDDETKKVQQKTHCQNDHVVETTVSLITDTGLYSFVFSSNMEAAKSSRTLITNEVLPSIRRTGQCLMPRPVGNKLMLLNETYLHYHVVAYLRRLHPNALIVPGLGELQDTFLKRSDAYRKGYKGGQQDFTIGNLHVH